VPSSKPDTSDQLPDDPIEIKEESVDDNPKPAENSLKGNLRKPNSSDPAAPKEELKKRVQWMDFVGKELVEIKEFECRCLLSLLSLLLHALLFSICLVLLKF
jgi:hypothetical protein